MQENTKSWYSCFSKHFHFPVLKPELKILNNDKQQKAGKASEILNLIVE